MAKKKEENAAVETEETKAKFREKTEKSAGTGKKETEHSGVSGDQRFFQGYES